MKTPTRRFFFIFVLIYFIHPQGKTQDITSGLVAHYQFENTTGDVIDETGNNNGSVSLIGVSRGVPGKVGSYAFQFDGSDGYVLIPASSDINPPSPYHFTLAYWVKSNGTQLGSYSRLNGFAGYDFELAVGGSINELKIYNGAWYNMGYQLSYNTWTHITTTYDGSIFRIYVNGTFIQSKSKSNRALTGDLTLASTFGGNENFNGSMDDVRMYNRVLTAADVAELFSPGGGSTPTLIVNNIYVNEGDGTAAFTISLNQTSSQSVSGTYSTSNGTALSSSDYISKSGSFSITAGQLSSTVNVTITDDTSVESSESFNLNITNPVNASILKSTGICTITDNDVAGLNCSNTITTFPYSEGFENISNTWTNATGDSTDWTRNSGSTLSSYTGPTAAQEGSYYNFIESTSPNHPYKTADLDGPCFDLAGKTSAEFSFYYHMYGSAMGTLELAATTDGSSWTPLWSKSGDQGNEWQQTTINLNSYLGGTVKLKFFGITSTSYTSDMSVDNITLTSEVGSGGVTSVNSYTGDVQLNLGLNGNNLSISGGNTINLPYGTSDITGINVGPSLSGGGTSGSISISARNTEALWNANKIQGLTISTTTPLTNQVLKYINGVWTPAEDKTGTAGSSYWSENGTDIYFNTGNVGIGTSSPDQALTVAGTIHAEEVIVDLSVPAPDYVFEPDYKLRSITELENFLTKNSHLPDIPSAIEMEQNGVSLSKINMMLLKRIEELTLYIIDQEKRIQEIESLAETSK